MNIPGACTSTFSKPTRAFLRAGPLVLRSVCDADVPLVSDCPAPAAAATTANEISRQQISPKSVARNVKDNAYGTENGSMRKHTEAQPIRAPQLCNHNKPLDLSQTKRMKCKSDSPPKAESNEV